jgi:predicted ATPase
MLTNCYIQDYNSIHELHINLTPITILFGSNGSGKSSILKALNIPIRDSLIYQMKYLNPDDLELCLKFSPEIKKLSQSMHNLWTVLYNLSEDRYKLVLCYMKECFPSLNNIHLVLKDECIWSYYSENGKDLIDTSQLSDGYIRMLIMLTALFQGETECLLFDEPEISLHPYAISIFAKAVKEVVEKYHQQIVIATQSPVLISQFENTDLQLVFRDKMGNTHLTNISEMSDIQDLLKEYAFGSLYMAELVGAQL